MTLYNNPSTRSKRMRIWHSSSLSTSSSSSSSLTMKDQPRSTHQPIYKTNIIRSSHTAIMFVTYTIMLVIIINHDHTNNYYSGFVCQGTSTPLPLVTPSILYQRYGQQRQQRRQYDSYSSNKRSLLGHVSLNSSYETRRDEERRKIENDDNSIEKSFIRRRRYLVPFKSDMNAIHQCSSTSTTNNGDESFLKEKNEKSSNEKQQQQQQQHQSWTNNNSNNHYTTSNQPTRQDERIHEYTNQYIQQQQNQYQNNGNGNTSSSSSSLWPPWPFSLLQKSKQQKSNPMMYPNHSGVTTSSSSSSPSPPSSSDKSAAVLFMTYLRQKAIIGLRQMQQVATALSYHLPPASPPILLLAILPTQASSSSTTIPPPPTSSSSSSSTIQQTTKEIAKQFTKKAKDAASKNNISSSISSSTSSNMLPFANVIARKLALASLGVAILSWADYEVRKKKRLTPLPMFYYSSLMNGSSSNHNRIGNNGNNGGVSSANEERMMSYKNGGGNGGENDVMITTRDLKNIILPPFLPEEVTIEQYDNEDDGEEKEEENEFKSNNSNPQQEPFEFTPSTMKQQIHDFYQSTIPILPRPKTFMTVLQSWYKVNQIRKQQEKNIKRQAIMEELIALQKIKKQRILNNQKHQNRLALSSGSWYNLRSSSLNSLKGITTSLSSTSSNVAPLGYALISGASRGIGRAFAVELARYEVPLILIARDEDKLASLAEDIQTAYGVPCIIIKADLSKHGTAKKIYETTKKAGLHVDILINNAGVCTTKDLVQSRELDIERMMNVNVASTTVLSHLYAKDMKEAKRGRILFVSSMVGAVPSGPGVATYAASKAYEKSLAQSMGRELEKYGVGVTCLMPGAVKDTSFAMRSNANEALCFKLPFYPVKAQNVASRGVRALLHSGDGEVIPGWHNRIFLKILMPVLPPRLTSSIVALAWSPFRSPWSRNDYDLQSLDSERLIDNTGKKQKIQVESNQDRLRTVLNNLPPRQLEIEDMKQQKKHLNQSDIDDQDFDEDVQLTQTEHELNPNGDDEALSEKSVLEDVEEQSLTDLQEPTKDANQNVTDLSQQH